MSIRVVEKMIHWIEENLEENPTLADISRHVGYSSYYCSTKFHEMTGMTIKKYISTRRIELATKSLTDSDLKIMDIAVKYGFSSHEAFTRAFSNIYGCSPYHYRKCLHTNHIGQ